MEKGVSSVNTFCPSNEVLSRFHDEEEVGHEAEHISSCLDCQRHLRELSDLDEILRAPLLPVKEVASVERPLRRLLYAAAAVVLIGMLWSLSSSSEKRYRIATTKGRHYTVSTNPETRLLSLEIDGEEVVRNKK
jgi:hypothetical protein